MDQFDAEIKVAENSEADKKNKKNYHITCTNKVYLYLDGKW